MIRLLACAVTGVCLACAGCGGSKSTDPPANRAPTARAGADQSVQPGAVVRLDGSGSSDPDGDALSYSWTAPATVVLSAPTEAQPTFTAGAVGTYRFSLVVSDGARSSAPDEVIVTVGQANRAPVAAAGPDQRVTAGATVQLDGSGSSDPDGDALSYAWTAPAGVFLSSTSGARPTFVAGAAGVYRVSLVVGDGRLTSPPDEVFITVEPGVPADTTFAMVQGQVLNASCALAGCHVDANQPDLAPARAWANLVDQPSSAGMDLVSPGDPEASYLYVKIAARPGMLGSRMPLGRPALSSADLAVVRAWIVRGAPND